ncbi:MAG: hypothetical protein P8Z78_14335 [Gammaproteobacteria bacterium]|jgi:hypothetical protein
MHILSTLSAIMLTFSNVLVLAADQATSGRDVSGTSQFDEADSLLGKRSQIVKNPATPPGVPIPYPNTDGKMQGDKKASAGKSSPKNSHTRSISTGGSGGEDQE